MPAAERKQQIAEITLELVAAYGVQATTTSRIADAAGVSQAALYRHFENRKSILLAALDALYERLYGVIQSSTQEDIRERLRAIGDFHSGLISSDQGTFVHPLFEFLAAAPEAGLREALGERQIAVIESLAATVEQGKSQGSVRSDVNSEQVAWELHGVYWAEDISYLMGLKQFITSGRSARMLNAILDRIAVRST